MLKCSQSELTSELLTSRHDRMRACESRQHYGRNLVVLLNNAVSNTGSSETTEMRTQIKQRSAQIARCNKKGS